MFSRRLVQQALRHSSTRLSTGIRPSVGALERPCMAALFHSSSLRQRYEDGKIVPPVFMMDAPTPERVEHAKRRKFWRKWSPVFVAGVSATLVTVAGYAFKKYSEFTSNVVIADCPSESSFVEYYDDEDMSEIYMYAPFVLKALKKEYSTSVLLNYFAWSVAKNLEEKMEDASVLKENVPQYQVGDKVAHLKVISISETEMVLKDPETNTAYLLRVTGSNGLYQMAYGEACDRDTTTLKYNIMHSEYALKMSFVDYMLGTVKKVYTDIKRDNK